MQHRHLTTRLVLGLAVALLGASLTASGCGGDDAASDQTGDPAEAASRAWQLVFDSEADVDAKVDHLAESAALRGTLEAFAETGATMGGISLTPTDVVIDGDSAVITYDVMFGGTVAYGDQTGTIALVDGNWTVSREEFCGFMASARTPCPGGGP